MYTLSEALTRPGGRKAHAYDVIVVGAGHAGSEAAIAAAKLGADVLLLTLTLDALANLPCNPSLGGTAKGQMIREIDALGGVMGILADRQMIQYRMLNQSRGPAVMSPRTQTDRTAYQRDMKQLLESFPNIRLLQQEATALIISDDKKAVAGVQTKTGTVYLAPAVIIASGTFLNAKVIVGSSMYDSGPDQLQPATELTDSLRALGLPVRRFKTGTPARIQKSSIDLDKLERQDSERPAMPFSFLNEDDDFSPKAELPCHMTWTTDQTRELILENIDRSPLYSGLIEGIGPRYCPSIEDKYVRFPDHLRHHVFIEPTGLDTEELYLSGLSTSMPEDVQEAMLKSVPGLEEAKIMRYGYAIEYDNVDPTALNLSLEVRALPGLYLAGQVNGSSGYEEAAAQGLIAGINAVRKLNGQDPVPIDRSQAYIFVLIDDLVSRGTNEPYRMMTSRAEYRLLLRQDNADMRLTPLGRELGLIDDTRYARFLEKKQAIEAEKERLDKVRVTPDAGTTRVLESLNSSPIKTGVSLLALLKRPEITYDGLAPLDPERKPLPAAWIRTLEYDIHYEGYIRLELSRRRKFQELERKTLPEDANYLELAGLRLEARQVLERRKPRTVGQASRLPGVTPADVSVLLVWLDAKRQAEKAKPTLEELT
ncbi:MAG TPA: tRNA uridine-5-carboxymethylaminomethyl(34) synthesis enzyme MnmG [Fastidiosipila sp.]|nr:tRNA uridine-5-carboxymethylaminomethyl(34) synthesis enzyme MnmG [Fastidiosipila sp.]